ncbi:MAG: helix-turn-helix domain-containing protein [Chitinivibrionales bacterium]|nr:helix-turn-helix domain-containing protein [Chitinivibrionales bacterium]
MTAYPLFYLPDRPLRVSSSLCVHAMGIREPMPPSVVRRDAPIMPWLFMYFHDEARLNPGERTELPAGGRTIIWQPNSRHAYGHETHEWHHSWLIAEGSLLESSVSANGIPVDRLVGGIDEALHERYLQALYNELHRFSPPDPFIVESCVQMWMREIARAIRHGPGQPISREMSLVREYIEANLHRDIRLGRLARVANLSISQFSNLFRRAFGASPLQYVNELRMKRAAMLLCDNSLGVKHIAALTGFDDPLYFSKRFRRRWGVSPREYRRMRGAGSGGSDSLAGPNEIAGRS